jgi:pSer/pThr/pTyr-binding forkhead associated (FHA) protein
MEAKAYLKPLTPESKSCLGTSLLGIFPLPFRVGRESRSHSIKGFRHSRRKSDSPANNELYLPEKKHRLNVSREHFQIELRGEEFYLVDLGSACGTLLEGSRIGGDRKGGEHKLHSGDVIIVGTSESHYSFKFLILKEGTTSSLQH